MTPPQPSGDVVVIGVGHPFRRDSGLGPAVADRLRAQRLPGVRLVVSEGDPAELIEAWDGAELAVVVDIRSVRSATPGRIHRHVLIDPAGAQPSVTGSADPDSGTCGGTTNTSAGSTTSATAGTTFGEAVELARVLGRMPRRLVLFTVEAGNVGYGPGLTPAVAAAAGRVATSILAEVTPAVGTTGQPRRPSTRRR